MKVLVLGGDTRQIYCAGRLSLESGMRVTTAYMSEEDGGIPEDYGCADIMVLPYVSSSDGYLNAPACREKIKLSRVLENINGKTLVFCSGISDDVLKRIQSSGAEIYDWLKDEELTLKNAYLTAEGAAQIIVSRSNHAVSGSNILILGCGRVAKACAGLFKSMGAGICVCARKESDRADCIRKGMDACDFCDCERFSQADIVVNTVPARVITPQMLEKIRGRGWILELASKPYGFDPAAAQSMSVDYVLGSGLPGKFTPEAAGELMAHTVIKEARKRHG